MRINTISHLNWNSFKKKIDRLIDEGVIKVNGENATAGIKVSDKDKIYIKGKKVNKSAERKVYYLLNKPLDVLSSVKDDRGQKTVVDLIKCKERIFPIGKLITIHSDGLMILTNRWRVI